MGGQNWAQIDFSPKNKMNIWKLCVCVFFFCRYVFNMQTKKHTKLEFLLRTFILFMVTVNWNKILNVFWVCPFSFFVKMVELKSALRLVGTSNSLTAWVRTMPLEGGKEKDSVFSRSRVTKSCFLSGFFITYIIGKWFFFVIIYYCYIYWFYLIFPQTHQISLDIDNAARYFS